MRGASLPVLAPTTHPEVPTAEQGSSSQDCFAGTLGHIATRLRGEPRSRAKGMTLPGLLAQGVSLAAGAPKGGELSLPCEEQGRRKVEGHSFLSTNTAKSLSNMQAIFSSFLGAKNPSCSLCCCQNLQRSSHIPGDKNPQHMRRSQQGWTGLGGMAGWHVPTSHQRSQS